MIPRSEKENETRDSMLLGPLETEIMEILWSRGRSAVRDVVESMRRPLAYTTVMTTLDRLFKKGLLERDNSDKAFFYVPALTHEEWTQKRAGQWVSGFLSGRNSAGEVLISCLVDAVSEHDEALLDALERQILLKRRELELRESGGSGAE